MRSTALPRAGTTPALLCLLLLSWLLLSLNATAHADGPLPNMRVTITPTASYHRVCVHGDSPGIVVAWQLTITGGGTDGPIAPVFGPAVRATYDQCYYVWKWGGDFAYGVTLTAVVAGSTTAPFVSEGAGLYLSGQDYYVNSG